MPYDTLAEAHCEGLFDMFFTERSSTSGRYELYIPAPEDAMREEAFQWHVTTRNFFAFIFQKPMVGVNLGRSLVDLQERLHLFRYGDVNNHADFRRYAEEMGYMDFSHNPDYALAFLYYAEQYQLDDMWIDAFAHCVGMNESLSMSVEFEPINRVTKALITRAYLEMDLHLGRVTAALSNFLEDDLSSTHLGLPQATRNHLDRFRSFLHAFYVEKFGYWPPPEGCTFSKALYRSMYFDFRNLYDYLVDLESTNDIHQQKPASGGICVLQNVQAFDRRHKYAALPHPMPLVPETPSSQSRRQSQKTLVAFKLGTKAAKTERILSARAAMTAATNSKDATVTQFPLVRAYMRFEREWADRPDEKVTIADARKVRWILIYAVLQMLVSVTRAPTEVRESEEPAYPLCCLVTGTLPWKNGGRPFHTARLESSEPPPAYSVGSVLDLQLADVKDKSLPSTPSIHPDCEANDYFTHTNTSHTGMTSIGRRASITSIEPPAPLRIGQSYQGSPVKRNSSIRSLRRLTSPFASRRNSVVAPRRKESFHEIVIHGYGNGLNETIVAKTEEEEKTPDSAVELDSDPIFELDSPSSSSSSDSERGRSRRARPANITLPTGTVSNSQRTPVLDSFDMDQILPESSGTSTPTDEEGSDNSSATDVSQLWSVAESFSSAGSSNSAHSVCEQEPSGHMRRISKASIMSASSIYSSHPNSPVHSRKTSAIQNQHQQVLQSPIVQSPHGYEAEMSLAHAWDQAISAEPHELNAALDNLNRSVDNLALPSPPTERSPPKDGAEKVLLSQKPSLKGPRPAPPVSAFNKHIRITIPARTTSIANQRAAAEIVAPLDLAAEPTSFYLAPNDSQVDIQSAASILPVSAPSLELDREEAVGFQFGWEQGSWMKEESEDEHEVDIFSALKMEPGRVGVAQ